MVSPWYSVELWPDTVSVTAVVVDFVPIGKGPLPPAVSFVAAHAGAFADGCEKVSVQVSLGLAPNVTLPAWSDPTMLVPIPQSDPNDGTANAIIGQFNNAAIVSSAASTTRLLERPFRIIPSLTVPPQFIDLFLI